KILFHVVHGNCPCDRRSEIRTEHKGISLPVKKFIQLSGRRRTDFTPEYIEKLKGRRLDLLISVRLKYFFYLLLKHTLPLTFFTENIPDPLRRMNHFIHPKVPPLCSAASADTSAEISFILYFTTILLFETIGI